MPDLKIPAFGEADVCEARENERNYVWSLTGAAELFDKYRALFLGEGYVERECYQQHTHRYAALQKGTDVVFLNAYGATDELRIVLEEGCRYFDFADCAGAARFAPQITQIKMRDYGMSYAIRLSDGRFLVIDGGYNTYGDAEALYDTLQALSVGEKPMIAAWILTHQHEDHFHCFLDFMEKYAAKVEVEKLLFNFPAHDDFAHYPELERDNAKLPNSRGFIKIPQLYALAEKHSIPVFTPHTGQKYRIGDANIEFLASIDDSIHVTKNGNATSLVFRMELGGQVILWTADAGCSYVRLDERYGNYLKADILQIPHHGFQSGTAEAEIRTYDFVDPAVCLLPSDRYCTYTLFCLRREGTKHLLLSERVQEVIDGDEQRTLVLPYTAQGDGIKERMRLAGLGLQNNGARAFVFIGLNTARAEDLSFTLLNTTVLPVTVRVDLYFEDKRNALRGLRTEVLGSSLVTCRLTGEEGGILPPEKQLPEGVPFAVRFLCDTPIVVSHPTHKAAYISSLCI